MDIHKRAKQMYRDEHKTAPFYNEEAWKVLRGHKEWDAPDPLDLTGDVPSQTNEALFGHDEQPRPIGKNMCFKETKIRDNATTGGKTSTGGSFSSYNFRD